MSQIRQFAVKSKEASQLRRRKYQLVRRYGLPENLVGGSLVRSLRRCGRSNCHCATGEGHEQWSLTLSHRGQRRVERVPREWVEDLEQEILATQTYLEAIREVMAINLELLALTRQQNRETKRTSRAKKRQSKPRTPKK